ncbi:SDR family NAD(P)-dependent oxidoreductase [Pseudonocardia acaciae]|uniref:SDR family NAD(P)-dependent oxidoreductase n=1 Tax=Pseudonocardia acaciae TaxID=551276 RepID=UPI000491D20E|nr:SDR family NAD(P)-dependent oxidoreductase [Pseudonocardia acaciae]
MLLTECVAVVSGADNAKGIGFAIARAFVAHGARVGLIGLGQRELAGLSDSLVGPDRAEAAIGIEADVTDPPAVASAVDRVVARFGRLTTVVANAGIVEGTALADVTPSALARMVEVNLGGGLNLVQAALPHLGPGGSIVTIGSIAAQQGGGLRGGPHYAASKGAVVSLTRAMARELGPRGIRANTIHPGIVRTPMTEDASPELEARQARGVPLGRLGEPDDIAGAAVFFASGLSRYTTGTDLAVNGGLYIG